MSGVVTPGESTPITIVVFGVRVLEPRSESTQRFVRDRGRAVVRRGVTRGLDWLEKPLAALVRETQRQLTSPPF